MKEQIEDWAEYLVEEDDDWLQYLANDNETDKNFLHTMCKKFLLLLKEKESLIDLSGTPDNYVSIQARVLQLELKQEIKTLQKMLSNSDNFEEEFKKRCASRDSGEIAAIPFRELPQSVTNSLYWEIALEVFKPNNLGEMLRIIAPQIKNSIEVSLNDTTLSLNNGESKDKQKKAMKDMLENGSKPVIEKKDGLALDKSPATLDELMHYVLENNVIFDVRTIKDYPLNSHSQLYSLLDDDYPQLAQKIYQHNSDMEQLRSDIDEFTKNGKTPQSAIEQLIKCLTSAGSQRTGQESAAESVYSRVGRFSEYLNSLPEDTLTQLKSLKYDNEKTLGNIIEDEIKKGECIEIAAQHLKALLDKNSKEEVLTKQLKRNPELEGRYATIKKRRSAVSTFSNDNNLLLDDKSPVLNTKKSIIEGFTFPKELSQKALQNIVPKTFDDLLSLLYNFPPEFYASLWEHINFQNPPPFLNNTALAIRQGYFNSAQKEALAQAIIAQYHRFKLNVAYILWWAITTNEILFFKEALASYSTHKQLFDALQLQDTSQISLLSRCKDSSFWFSAILESLPNHKRLAALQMANQNKGMININTLIKVLGLLPDNDKLAAVQLIYKEGKFVLSHYILIIILNLLPEKDRLTIVQIECEKTQNTIMNIIQTPDQLKAIVRLLPYDDKLAAVQLFYKIENLILNYELLILNLELLRETDRLAIIQIKDEQSQMTIMEIIQTPDQFKTILGLLPYNDRLAAVQLIYKTKNFVLKYEILIAILELLSKGTTFEIVEIADDETQETIMDVIKAPDEFITILKLLPNHQRFAAVKLGHKNKHIVLKDELSKTILDLIPDDDKLKAVHLIYSKGGFASKSDSLKYIKNLFDLEKYSEEKAALTLLFDEEIQNTVLHTIASEPNRLKEKLNFLPENKRLVAIERANEYGNTVLHCAVSNPKSLKIILDLYKEKDRFELLLIENYEGETVLYLALSHPKSLKVILESFLDTDEILFFKKILASYSTSEQSFDMLQLLNADPVPVLRRFKDNSLILSVILKSLPGNKRLAALQVANNHEDGVNVSTLIKVLGLLPSNYRLAAVQLIYKTENFISKYEILITILKLLPEKDRLTIIQEKDDKAQEAVIDVIKTPDQFKAIIDLLPDYDRHDAAHRISDKKNFVLKCELLTAIEDILPKILIRFDAVEIEDDETQKAIMDDIKTPDEFITILKVLQSDERFEAVKLAYKNKHIVFKDESLKTILELIPDYEKIETVQFIYNKGDLSGYDSLKYIESTLELEQDSEKRAEITLLFDEEIQNTVLHTIASEPNLLKNKLDFLPENKRLAAIKRTNEHGNTVLHCAASNPDSLKIILDLYEKDEDDDKFKLLLIENYAKETVLHLALSHPESLKVILGSFLGKDDYIPRLVKFNWGDPCEALLHLAIPSPESLKIILGFLWEAKNSGFYENMVEMLEHMIDDNSNTVLHLAVFNPESLKIILEFLPKNMRFEAISIANDESYTVLDLATSNPESLKIILKFLEEEDRFELIKQMVDGDGNTILHLAASNPDSLKIILEFIPENMRLEAIKIVNNKDYTILHLAASNPESLKIILEFFGKEDRFKMIQQMVDEDANTVLHLAALNPDSLKIILEFIPENMRLEAIKMVNNKDYTILHLATSNPESLKTILEFLELLGQEDRFKMIQQMVDKYANTVLHFTASNPDSLKIILEFIPENMRLKAIDMVNDNKNTLLRYAACNFNALKIILDCLPKNDRLIAVVLANKNGNTILHAAALQPEFLKDILERLPESDRLAAVKLANQDGNTVLHLAAFNHDSLKLILSLLLEKDVLALLKQGDVRALFIKSDINLSGDNVFKHSFASSFIAISFFLEEQEKTDNQIGFFQKQTGASELIKELNEMDTFDEIKKHLESYVMEYENPLAEKLSALMVARDYSNHSSHTL